MVPGIGISPRDPVCHRDLDSSDDLKKEGGSYKAFVLDMVTCIGILVCHRGLDSSGGRVAGGVVGESYGVEV